MYKLDPYLLLSYIQLLLYHFDSHSQSISPTSPIFEPLNNHQDNRTF